MKVEPLASVKAHLSALLDEVSRTHEQYMVTRNGQPVAVILAADALSRTTSASGIFRGDGLAPHPAPLALHCACTPDQVLAG